MKSARVRPASYRIGLAALGSVGLLVLSQCAPRTGEAIVINNTSVPAVPTLDSNRVDRGATLYALNCAACHGANLEGAPDWKRSLPDGSFPPPPHDSAGHTWHHPDTLLLQIMAEGGDPAYNSKMPGFGDTLSPDDLATILEFIKTRWGKDELEFQWWITVTQGDP